MDIPIQYWRTALTITWYTLMLVLAKLELIISSQIILGQHQKRLYVYDKASSAVRNLTFHFIPSQETNENQWRVQGGLQVLEHPPRLGLGITS